MRAKQRSRSGPILLVAAAGTLVDLELAVRASGAPGVRFDATHFQPCLTTAQKRALRAAAWDGVIVSSPRVLDLFLVPVLGRPPDRRPAPVAYVAGEPTAVDATKLGYPVVRPTGAGRRAPGGWRGSPPPFRPVAASGSSMPGRTRPARVSLG
jgi:hypothetical protein